MEIDYNRLSEAIADGIADGLSMYEKSSKILERLDHIGKTLHKDIDGVGDAVACSKLQEACNLGKLSISSDIDTDNIADAIYELIEALKRRNNG